MCFVAIPASPACLPVSNKIEPDIQLTNARMNFGASIQPSIFSIFKLQTTYSSSVDLIFILVYSSLGNGCLHLYQMPIT
jgi:hypothetical protein